MTGLTTGVIADIFEGAHPENPVLQILGMKSIFCHSGECCRLKVSDGHWCSCSFLLHTSIIDRVASGEISKKCIVQLNHYTCESIPGMKAILIYDLRVKCPGDKVGATLGNPVIYEANTSKAEQQITQASRHTPAVTAGGSLQLNPQSLQSPQLSHQSQCIPQLNPQNHCSPQPSSQSQRSPQLNLQSPRSLQLNPQSQLSPQLNPQSQHSLQLNFQSQHSPQLNLQYQHSPQLNPQNHCSPQLSPQSQHSPQLNFQSQCSPQLNPQNHCSPQLSSQSHRSPQLNFQSQCSSQLNLQSQCSLQFNPQSQHSPQLNPQSQHSLQLNFQSQHSRQLNPQCQHSPQLNPQSQHSLQLNPQNQRSPADCFNSIHQTVSLSSLTPHQTRWKICARVSSKSNIRTFSNIRGNGKLFTVSLCDDSGEILATAFNTEVDKFYDMIQVNKVYYIANATLKIAKKQFTNLDNDYEMTFNWKTMVTPCLEVTAFPAIHYNFVSFDQLESLDNNYIVDIIGVCKETMSLSTVQMRSSNVVKRDVQIVDDTKREVQLTLWESVAERFDGSQHPVLAVKGAKLTDFCGRSLSMLYSSSLQIDPDIKEAHKLKNWYENGGNAVTTINLSKKRDGAFRGVGYNFKTFFEAKMENQDCKKKVNSCFLNKATIILMLRENVLYTACPSENCNKKVHNLDNGLYKCEKCNCEYDKFKWRLMVQTNIADFTDSLSITVFQEHAETLLQVSAEKLSSMKDDNPREFKKIFEASSFKNYIFKFRARMETFKDESHLKHAIVECLKLDPKKYNHHLISEIKQMSGLA